MSVDTHLAFSITRTLLTKYDPRAQQLAQKPGVTGATISRIKSHAGNPIQNTIQALGSVFHLFPGELLKRAAVVQFVSGTPQLQSG